MTTIGRAIALAIGGGMTSMLAFGQELPLSPKPQWVSLHKSDGLKSEFDKAGVYSHGGFTYVAVRDLDADAPDAFVFSVLALRCKQKTLAMATLGRMSLDGRQVDYGTLNDESKLEKYGVPLNQLSTPYGGRLFKAVCEQ